MLSNVLQSLATLAPDRAIYPSPARARIRCFFPGGGRSMRYFLILVGAAVVAYLLARGIAAVLSDRKRSKTDRDSK
ncbi:hypothetical protein QWC_03058 [Achromobacter marplatensis]|nr:hypothetical protein QWC_03058 [Achromobacter marplatensis]